MVIYLIAFAASLCIIQAIQRWERGSVGFFFWSATALFIPCLIAGLRASSVGTDVMGYAQPLFSLAKANTGFSDYYLSVWWRGWRYYGPADLEFGYSALAWLCARLFGSFQSFLFITQALTVVPIYVAVAKYRERFAIAPVMATYYLMFFNMSLNLMRQFIALGFIFLAIVGFYRSGRGLKGQAACLASLFIAVFFHSSAIMGFLILAIRLFLDGGNGRVIPAWRAWAVVALALSALVAVPVIQHLLVTLGFTSYAQYLGNGGVGFKSKQLLLYVPLILMALSLVRQSGTNFDLFLFTVVAVGLVLTQLSSLDDQGGRIGVYFIVFGACVPGALGRLWSNDALKRSTVSFLYSCYLLAYWVFVYVFAGSSETVPYLFYWL